MRSIAKLEEQGEHGRAERARSMRHVLAPRPGADQHAADGPMGDGPTA